MRGRQLLVALLACAPLLAANLWPNPGPGRAPWAAPGPSTITASIVPNRTTGASPLSVHFDATGSDCDGDETPGETQDDLERCRYGWDFGDPSSPDYEYGARHAGGFDSSSNVQTGYIGGHVYECAGPSVCNFTATLTIRNPSGEQDQETVGITVTPADTAWSGATFCYSTSGTFTGCPAGATTATRTDFNTALGAGTDNANVASGAKRALFRCGETFTQSANGPTPSNSATLIGAFGGCEGTGTGLPVIDGTGSTFLLAETQSGSDTRLVDLEVDGSILLPRPTLLFYGSRLTGVTFEGAPAFGSTSGTTTYVGVFRSRIEDNSTYGVYHHQAGTMIVGSRIANNGGPGCGGNCHNMRYGNQSRSVHASNDFGPGAATGGNNYRLHGEHGGTQRVVLWDNEIASVGDHALSVGESFRGAMDCPDGDGEAGVYIGVIEGNFFRAGSSGIDANNRAINIVDGAGDLVIRNNVFDLTTRFSSAVRFWENVAGSDCGGAQSPRASNVTVANNSAAWRTGTNSTGSAVYLVSQPLVSGVVIQNNAFYNGGTFSGAVESCTGGSTCTDNSAKLTSNPFTGVPDDPSGFEINVGSALYQQGTALSSVIDDFSGALRPAPPSHGAWEP